VLGGAAYLALQTLAILDASTQVAAPSSACAATVIIGSSLAAWRARKIPKWFGQAGIGGGIAVLAVGLVEGGADWTLAGDAVYASSLGFMVWVVVTATYLLRR
jgi:peptidoglycan/LPS O-acetylase OafA/YrhL